MKRSALALLAVLALVVAACGGTTDGTTTTAGDTTTSAATPDSTTTTAADPRADWPDKLIFGFVPSREAEELQDVVGRCQGADLRLTAAEGCAQGGVVGAHDAFDVEVEGVGEDLGQDVHVVLKLLGLT